MYIICIFVWIIEYMDICIQVYGSISINGLASRLWLRCNFLVVRSAVPRRAASDVSSLHRFTLPSQLSHEALCCTVTWHEPVSERTRVAIPWIWGVGGGWLCAVDSFSREIGNWPQTANKNHIMTKHIRMHLGWCIDLITRQLNWIKSQNKGFFLSSVSLSEARACCLY